jgi:hypothetical protein
MDHSSTSSSSNASTDVSIPDAPPLTSTDDNGIPIAPPITTTPTTTTTTTSSTLSSRATLLADIVNSSRHRYLDVSRVPSTSNSSSTRVVVNSSSGYTDVSRVPSRTPPPPPPTTPPYHRAPPIYTPTASAAAAAHDYPFNDTMDDKHYPPMVPSHYSIPPLPSESSSSILIARSYGEVKLATPAPVPVAYLKCDQCDRMILDRGDRVASHRNILCQKGRISCTQGCGSMVPSESILDHVNEICPSTLVSCIVCEASVTRRDMTTHWLRSCDTYLVQCKTCNVWLHRTLYNNHYADHLNAMDASVLLSFDQNDKHTHLSSLLPASSSPSTSSPVRIASRLKPYNRVGSHHSHALPNNICILSEWRATDVHLSSGDDRSNSVHITTTTAVLSFPWIGNPLITTHTYSTSSDRPLLPHESRCAKRSYATLDPDFAAPPIGICPMCNERVLASLTIPDEWGRPSSSHPLTVAPLPSMLSSSSSETKSSSSVGALSTSVISLSSAETPLSLDSYTDLIATFHHRCYYIPGQWSRDSDMPQLVLPPKPKEVAPEPSTNDIIGPSTTSTAPDTRPSASSSISASSSSSSSSSILSRAVSSKGSSIMYKVPVWPMMHRLPFTYLSSSWLPLPTSVASASFIPRVAYTPYGQPTTPFTEFTELDGAPMVSFVDLVLRYYARWYSLHTYSNKRQADILKILEVFPVYTPLMHACITPLLAHDGIGYLGGRWWDLRRFDG